MMQPDIEKINEARQNAWKKAGELAENLPNDAFEALLTVSYLYWSVVSEIPEPMLKANPMTLLKEVGEEIKAMKER